MNDNEKDTQHHKHINIIIKTYMRTYNIKTDTHKGKDQLLPSIYSSSNTKSVKCQTKIHDASRDLKYHRHWQPIRINETYVYSAYFDDRFGSFGRLRIFGPIRIRRHEFVNFGF